jgi:hypothetical protein
VSALRIIASLVVSFVAGSIVAVAVLLIGWAASELFFSGPEWPSAIGIAVLGLTLVAGLVTAGISFRETWNWFSARG